ncbi:DUF4870 domain-containing protein [Aequorivita echinoideorum]|uniref:DUF4870 domain-containing protein n=1 Tax=Aequorivita echinoideorum TaxID=1549647 RepID=A0ABS5S591_9FLAO|nr:DUF4870 domain-containing protein [Aequorivita echinoideorum]MBT0608391.1 DUF4870 domain-containing protein [Aequorivita echinoideorum]
MYTTLSETEKNTSAFIHLSTFLKYFFPFANFFAPLLIWTFNKEKAFVDEHGRQAINFQLSILIYTLSIGLLCVPFFIIFATDFVSLMETINSTSTHISLQNFKNLSGYLILFGLAILLLLALFIFELYAVVNATMHAAKGSVYKYPLSIPFIKTNYLTQPENEHHS